MSLEAAAPAAVPATPAPAEPGAPAAGSEPTGPAPGSQQPAAHPPASPEPAKAIESMEDARAVIDNLRKENAGLRTKSKDQESKFTTLENRFSNFETGLKKLFGGESDDMTPEQQVEALSAKNEHLEMQQALKDVAFEYEVPKANFDYFEFLVGKRLNELEEGQELSDEDLQGLVAQAKQAGANADPSTSVDGGSPGGNPPAPQAPAGGTTLEEFEVMGIMARSQLYSTSPKLYDQLKAQEDAAKRKR